MLTVGLTGGVASGKSEAAKVFRENGVVVIDADQIAKNLLAPQGPLAAEVARLFGDSVLDSGRHLDRNRLRKLVFSSTTARQQLESKLHPPISDLIRKQIKASQEQGQRYVVVMAPLLIEAGLSQEMDRILVIDCPESMQVARLILRDKETVKGANKIIRAQMPRKERLLAADDVIDNNSTPEELRDAVLNLHRQYLKLAGPLAPSYASQLGNKSPDC